MPAWFNSSYRVISDPTVSRSALWNAEINFKSGFEAPIALDATSGLWPVPPVDHAVERLFGGHCDGHSPPHAVHLHCPSLLLQLWFCPGDLEVTGLIFALDYFICSIKIISEPGGVLAPDDDWYQPSLQVWQFIASHEWGEEANENTAKYFGQNSSRGLWYSFLCATETLASYVTDNYNSGSQQTMIQRF